MKERLKTDKKSIFWKSVVLLKKKPVIMLFDILFIMAVVGIFVIIAFMARSATHQLSAITPVLMQVQSIYETNQNLEGAVSDELLERMAGTKDVIFSVFIKGVAYLFFIILLTVFFVSLIQGKSLCMIRDKIKNKIGNKKARDKKGEGFSLKFFKNFFIVNLIWFFGWVLLFFALFHLIRLVVMPAILLIILLAFLILSPILYFNFSEKKKLLIVYKDFFSLFPKLHKVALNYLIMFAVILAVFFIFLVLASIFKSVPFMIILFLVSFILTTSWSRIYTCLFLEYKVKVSK